MQTSHECVNLLTTCGQQDRGGLNLTCTLAAGSRCATTEEEKASC
jgi:hypothetical protein